MPRLGGPHAHLQHPAGEPYIQGQVLAIIGQGRHHRQVVWMRAGMGYLLVAVAVYGLGEIAHIVEQPNGHKGQAHVTGRLAMVPGEYPQASGVNRETLVESELQAKVGDQVFFGIEQLRQLRSAAILPVGVIGRGHPAIVFHVGAIHNRLVQTMLGYPAQERLWVVATGLP